MRRWLAGLAGATASLLVLVACSGGAGAAGTTSSAERTRTTASAEHTRARTAPATPRSDQRTSVTTAAAGTATQPKVDKLLVLVFENHSAGQARARMPQLDWLARRYGYASNWYAVTHPSLPNYLKITGGSTFGVRDDHEPKDHPLSGASVLGQLARHGHRVAVYADDMPRNCATHRHGDYAVKHNAWAYFTGPSERRLCRSYDVPAGTPSSGNLRTAVDRGRLPAYAQLIPDLCHDGHDCSLRTADAWLTRWMRLIRHGPDFRSGRLAVVITFDEDDHNADNHVATVVVARALRNAVVSRKLTHASLAAAPSRMVGLTPLRGAKGWPDVLRVFGLR